MNRTLTIILILFLLIVIVFSTIEIKYIGSNNKKDNIPIDLLDNRTNTGLQEGIKISDYDINKNNNSNNSSNNKNKNKKSNSINNIRGGNNVLNNNNNKQINGITPKNIMLNELWHLPEKDEYMTLTFKNQIDDLHNKYLNDISLLSSI